jgi:hypothetical protein
MRENSPSNDVFWCGAGGPKTYLLRNRHIVDASSVLIATPKGDDGIALWHLVDRPVCSQGSPRLHDQDHRAMSTGAAMTRAVLLLALLLLGAWSPDQFSIDLAAARAAYEKPCAHPKSNVEKISCGEAFTRPVWQRHHPEVMDVYDALGVEVLRIWQQRDEKRISAAEAIAAHNAAVDRFEVLAAQRWR